MKLTTKMLSLLVVLACSSCGGGGGDSAPPPLPPPAPPPAPPPPPPPAPLDHIGVWVGSMTYRLDHQALCRIVRDELTCVLMFGKEVVAAIDGRNQSLVLPPNQWAGNGTVFDSSGQKPFELVGGSVTATTLTLEFNIDGVLYRFVGGPAAPPPVSLLIGVYSEAYMRGAISLRIDSNELSANDTVFGQGGGGCTINGGMEALAYYGQFVQLDLFHCGVPDGTYNGFGILTNSPMFPQPSAPTTLVFVVSRGAQHWLGGYALK